MQKVARHEEYMLLFPLAAISLQIPNSYHGEYHIKMSEAMMPISVDALNYRAILFDLSKPVIMSPEIFEEAWPYVDFDLYKTSVGHNTCSEI